MKKERKLKLVVNKVKISNLNGVFGGTDRTTDDTRIDTCVFPTDVSCALTCDDTTSAIVRSEPCNTGDTKTNRSLLNCLDSAGC